MTSRRLRRIRRENSLPVLLREARWTRQSQQDAARWEPSMHYHPCNLSPCGIPPVSADKDERTLARVMHRQLCPYNHMDQCSWEYEIHAGIHQWSGWAHQRWLEKAHNLTARTSVPIGDLMKVIEAL